MHGAGINGLFVNRLSVFHRLFYKPAIIRKIQMPRHTAQLEPTCFWQRVFAMLFLPLKYKSTSLFENQHLNKNAAIGTGKIQGF